MATSNAADVTLAWDPVNDPAVAGYKVYYGLSSRTYGTPLDAGTATQLTFTGLPDGKNAYFAVTAYDTSKNESAFSTELVCFTIVPSVSGPGTISPSVTTIVDAVFPMTFSMTPSAGAVLNDVLVDGKSMGKVTSYLFSGVTSNRTIQAIFVKTLPAITGLRIKP